MQRIDRLMWGLKWNVPLGGGGLLVSEKVKLEIDGELGQDKEAVADAAVAQAESTADAGGASGAERDSVLADLGRWRRGGQDVWVTSPRARLRVGLADS